MRNSTNNKNNELLKQGKTLKCFALKLRIYPNLEQIEYFNNAFGCSRALYNVYLYKRINLYNNFKETYYLNDL